MHYHDGGALAEPLDMESPVADARAHAVLPALAAPPAPEPAGGKNASGHLHPGPEAHTPADGWPAGEGDFLAPPPGSLYHELWRKQQQRHHQQHGHPAATAPAAADLGSSAFSVAAAVGFDGVAGAAASPTSAGASGSSCTSQQHKSAQLHLQHVASTDIQLHKASRCSGGSETMLRSPGPLPHQEAAAGAASGPHHFVTLELKDNLLVTPAGSTAGAPVHAPTAAAPEVGNAGLHARTPRTRVIEYFKKWKGVGDTPLPRDPLVDILWTWLGAFLSIALVASLNCYFSPHVKLPLLIASFGATAVLLFGVPASKLGQPRNLFGGHLLSAVVGIIMRLIFDGTDLVWLSSALGMSLALAVMQVTQTVHPPGGATALIAASAVTIGDWHGFKFLLTVFFGCCGMLVIALVVNNLSSRRRYPTFWW